MMLQTVEIDPKSSPSASVIWLHGLGADGYDFVDIIPLLNLPPELNVRFVFPHAPIRPVTYAGNTKMRAWFNVVDLKHSSQVDEEGIRKSQELINELIARELAHKKPDYKVILAGFSQGGVMALQCGLRYPKKLTGILVLSGWLFLEDTLSLEKTAINQQVPILMLHGTEDDLIPLNWAQKSSNCLKELDYSVELLSYPVAHSLCAEEVTKIGSWIRKLLITG